MIHTVTGPIAPEALGLTLMHEHILWGWVDEVKAKHAQELVVETMLPHLDALQQKGCRTLVEATPFGAGRDIELLYTISKRSGMQIICNAGVWDGLDYQGRYVPHMIREAPRDEIAALWEVEYVAGIDGTDIRPGFIKLGFGDDDTITAFQAKILAAAMQTSVRTGLPIQAHICSAVSARATVDTLESAHFPLHKFIWTHADYPYDLETIVHLAKKGIWIGLDWWVPTPRDISWHVQALTTFEQEDLLGRLLISQDAGGYHAGQIVPYTPLFEEFIPRCIERGISETLFEQVLTINPARVLSIDEP